MNDSFRTDVFVQYQPETIGCACIYLAARQLQIPLPNQPHWYSIFNVDEAEVRDICHSILRLYARPKPNYDELEKVVNDAKKIQIEAKLKAKGLSSEQNTPNSSSRPCTPKNVSPNPALIANLKKLNSELELQGNGTPSEKTKNHIFKKRSRSKSRSPRSHSSHSRSPRSTSRSPAPKSRKYRSPPKKLKKDRSSPERYLVKDKHHSRKHEKRRRRSVSRSPSRSVSISPDRRHSSHKKYYKEKIRYRSPQSSHRRSHKHRNGHGGSPVYRDR